MSDIEALRATILQQVDAYGTKRRFGLFSHPISTAIGDDGQYKTKLHSRNEMGKPITEPRNFYTNPTKKGQTAYFQKLKSLATSDKKDAFIQQSRRLLQQQNQAFSKGRKQASFVPASLYKTVSNAAYKYFQQKNPQLDPKRCRQQDGKVKLQPRNFYTNSMSKVDKSLFKNLDHISDPYNRKHNMQIELLKKAKSKQAQQSFRPNNFVPKLLNTTRQVYFVDDGLKAKPIKQPKFNIFNHEVPFRRSSPPKEGYNGFMAPFPKYIQNPPKQIKRKDPVENAKQSFRSMSTGLSKPCPSITMMSARRSFHNNSFSRR